MTDKPDFKSITNKVSSQILITFLAYNMYLQTGQSAYLVVSIIFGLIGGLGALALVMYTAGNIITIMKGVRHDR